MMLANEERCRMLMDEHGIDVLVVSDPYNFCYMTGFVYGPMYWSTDPLYLRYDHVPVASNLARATNGGFCVYPRDSQPFAIAHRYMSSRIMKNMSDVREFGSAYLKARMPEDWYKADPVALLIDGLSEKGLAGAKIGFDTLDAPVCARLKEALPKALWVEAQELMMRLREVKTPEEIRRIRRACGAAVSAFSAALEMLEQGMTEIEFSLSVKRMVEEDGAKEDSFMDLVCSEMFFGQEKGGHDPRSNPIRPGDRCLYDPVTYYKGYFSDFQ